MAVFLEDVSWPGRPAEPSEAVEPSADFVFVHGLNPHSRPNFARATWTHTNGNFWPTAQIGQLAPRSRVFLYSYNSHVAWDVSLNGIDQHAKNLLVRLSEKRAADGDDVSLRSRDVPTLTGRIKQSPRPIVFVAHSLGGLVVKEALVIAKNNDSFKKIRKATSGLVFFAVPHQGGHGTTIGSVLRNVITAVNGEEHNDLLKSLQSNSLFQQQQIKLFREQLEDYQVLSVVEDLPTVLGKVLWRKTSKVIVDATSATLGLSGTRETVTTLNANHSDVCRFAGDDASFEPIKSILGRLAKLPPKGSGSARKYVHLIRFPPNPQFVGRGDQLADLRRRLFDEAGGHCPRVALHGLGGVGKTQIVVQFAYQIQNALPHCSILWISAISPESVEQAYKEIARRFRIAIPAGEMAETVRYVHEYLSRDAAGQWLLIVDNVDARGVLPGSGSTAASSADIFPCSKRGAILCTTRTREMATALAQSNVMAIEAMTPEVAEKLLSESLIDKHLLGADARATSSLLQDLTYLPLAITQAAAYINSTGVSIARYLHHLRATETSMVQTLSRAFEDHHRYPESKNPVAATWLVSFLQMQREEPRAAELLAFLACMEPVGLVASMLPQDQPAESVEFAMGKLRTYSFIMTREDEGEFDMHRLVHMAARSWVRSEGGTESAQVTAARRLDDIYPDPRFENSMRWHRLFPHAQKLLHDYEAATSVEWWRLSMKVGRSHYLDGRMGDAVRRYEVAARWAVATLVEDDPDRLTSQHELAVAYWANGQVGKAVTILEHVVKVQEALAEDHPSRLASQHALAKAYRANGQIGKAITILEYVVKVKEALVEDHPSRLVSQHELAVAYEASGQVGKAVTILEYVVKVREALAEDHPDRLVSQHELARAYEASGQVGKAVTMLEHVVKVEEALAEDHPDRLASQHTLAIAYEASGQVGKAVTMLEHVVKMEEALAEDHPSRLVSQHELAIAYEASGQVGKAVTMLEHVVKVEEALAEDHPSRLASQHELAGVYRASGQIDKAVTIESMWKES